MPTPNPRYTEQWRAMVETGVFCGPAKVSFISAWTPGPDRRNSTIIGKQSAAFVWHPTFDLFLGNYDVFRPYSWLFTYNYGSGFNAYNLSLDGYLRDAWFLGSRVDYAVAANLNVYGTFAWMERTSNGYGWGAIAPAGVTFPSADLSIQHQWGFRISEYPGSLPRLGSQCGLWTGSFWKGSLWGSWPPTGSRANGSTSRA